jgi:hypothetical protein
MSLWPARSSGPAPGLFDGLLDDAAMFPPGDLPLAQAVPGHLAHQDAGYGGLVGPLVVAAGALDELARVTSSLAERSLEVALTTPVPRLGEALARAAGILAVRVVAVEVALPDDMSEPEAVEVIGRHADEALRVFVELPRDERRAPLLARIAEAGHAAKLRTGGLSADAHPSEDELAAAVVAVVRAGVPFKATAGLHSAVRRTEPGTGFEQHGFLNLLVATAAARGGADAPDVSRLLAERDPERVAAGVREVDRAVRESFRSFGTCSVVEPVEQLAALGLLGLHGRSGSAAGAPA